MQIFIVPDEMFIGFALPEGGDFCRQTFINLVRGERFPTVQYATQCVAGQWPHDDVDVIGHHHPRVQLITLAVKELNRSGDQSGEFGIAQVTGAVAGIEVFVNTAGIPTKQFLLLVPGQRAFGGQRLLKDGVALLFESKQDLLWQRTRLPEGDEIGAAILL